MKEFFQELVKQKSSMLLVAGMLLLLLGITSGLQAGTVSISIEPAYRIISILSGLLLILIGIILAWKDSSESKLPDVTKGKDKYSGKGDELREMIEKSSQIDAIGYSLRSLIHSRQNSIVSAVKKGASVRLLVIDPGGNSNSMNVMEKIKPETGIRKDIKRSLEIAQIKIQNEVKQSSLGRFEIRVIDWIPSCSLLILDGATEDGWMEVGYFPPDYKYAVGHKVYIHFSKKEEKSRFDDYYEEFNHLWTIAKICELDQL